MKLEKQIQQVNTRTLTKAKIVLMMEEHDCTASPYDGCDGCMEILSEIHKKGFKVKDFYNTIIL